jgi:hypothetical protein
MFKSYRCGGDRGNKENLILFNVVVGYLVEIRLLTAQ